VCVPLCFSESSALLWQKERDRPPHTLSPSLMCVSKVPHSTNLPPPSSVMPQTHLHPLQTSQNHTRVSPNTPHGDLWLILLTATLATTMSHHPLKPAPLVLPAHTASCRTSGFESRSRECNRGTTSHLMQAKQKSKSHLPHAHRQTSTHLHARTRDTQKQRNHHPSEPDRQQLRRHKQAQKSTQRSQQQLSILA